MNWAILEMSQSLLMTGLMNSHPYDDLFLVQKLNI